MDAKTIQGVTNTEGDWLNCQSVDVKDNIFFPGWVQDMLSDASNFQDRRKVAMLKQFFAKNSEVCASVIEEHGTFRITHIAYTGNNIMGQPVTGIDRWLWEHNSAQALRDRLETVSRKLAEYLEPILRSGITYRVRDLGGSDGPYFFRTVEILQEAGVPIDNLRWTIVDQNELAITLGQAKAAERELEGVVEFIHASFMKPESFPASEQEADLVLAIGIVCSLPPHMAMGFLNGIKGHMKMGTRLFVPTLSDRCFRDDHESYLVYRIVGWHLWPKTADLVKSIFEAVGFKIDGSFESEREGGHYHFVWATY